MLNSMVIFLDETAYVLYSLNKKVSQKLHKMLDKNVWLKVLKIKNVTIGFSMKNYPKNYHINRQKIKIFGKKIFHRFFS
jgi:hypothetical protein